MSKTRPIALATLLLLSGTLLSLSIVEVYLRRAGHLPADKAAVGLGGPRIHVPDPLLGWRNQPGAYSFPDFSNDGKIRRATFWPSGARATRVDSGDRYDQVLLVGCSVTQGWALPDDETFAWKLQERFPHAGFLNFGTAGYGTYQSLLLLERLFHDGGVHPKLVIYGFETYHEMRNVAPPLWSWLLSTRRGEPVAVPYCTLDPDGALKRNPAEAYPRWPLHRVLATVAFLEQMYAEARSRGRGVQGRRVTEALLAELNSVSRTNGAEFLVVILGANPREKRDYINFLNVNDIHFVDCTNPAGMTAEMKVPIDGHPNGPMNAIWADCIGAHLQAEFPTLVGSSGLKAGPPQKG